MDIRRIAVIGTGVIGASWAAHFLAHGRDVTACDPAPGAEDRLRQLVAEQYPAAARLGTVPGRRRRTRRPTIPPICAPRHAAIRATGG